MSAALDEIQARLRRFSDAAAETSPLYSTLAGAAAADADVARLLTVAADPRPELFFAAVQRVLQAEPFHELTNYYPALGGTYGPDNALWPLFRAFVTQRADRIRTLVAMRVVRTNDVGRAALFYPAVALATRTAGGGPVGLGRFAGRREETFAAWKASIQQAAKCPNVVVKLGGLAMRLLGHDFHERAMPPSSEQAAAAWRPYIESCIEAFGPARCMFESNFPPDKGQCSYQVIFNAFKRIAAQYSEAEKTALFSKTAADFYRLKLG